MYFYYYLRSLKQQRWGVKSCNPLISSVSREKKGLNLAGTKLWVWFKFFPHTPLFAKSFLPLLRVTGAWANDLCWQVISKSHKHLAPMSGCPTAAPGPNRLCAVLGENPSFPPLGTDRLGGDRALNTVNSAFKGKEDWSFSDLSFQMCSLFSSQRYRFSYTVYSLGMWPYLQWSVEIFLLQVYIHSYYWSLSTTRELEKNFVKWINLSFYIV